MNPINMAAKERNDQILEEMEKEIEAKAADPNATPETVTPPAEEKTPASTSAQDETTTPPSETPAPAAKPDGGKPVESEELTEEEVQKLSGKARTRFERLAKENLRIKKENEFLRTHTKQEETPAPETPSTPAFKLPWEGASDEESEGEDVAIVARREALLAVAEERRQETILSNLQADSTELETKFPEFDPKHESYDPTLVTKISVWYKGLFKDNNDLRLKDFVTELMDLRAQGIAQGKSEVTETVVRQAASQAVVPTAPSGQPSDSVVKKIQGARSIEELEKLEAQI